MTVMPDTWQRPGPWLFGLLAGIASIAVALSVSAVSPMLAVALTVALGTVALVVWTGEPRRVLIVALFATTPLDISKAIVSPIEQFYSPGLYLSPAHLMVLGLCGVLLFQRIIVERRAPPVGRLDVVVFAYLAIIWSSAFFSPQGYLALATAANYSLCIAAFYVASYAIRDKTDLRLAFGTAAVLLLLEGLHVAAQIATGSLLPLPGSKNAFPLSSYMFAAGGGFFLRPTGFRGHPNVLGHDMVTILPPALALVLLGRHHLGSRTFFTALAVLAVAAIVLLLTLSRGGWTSCLLGVGLVVFVFARRGVLNRRQLAGFVLAAGAALAALLVAYPQAVLRVTSPDSRSIESRVVLTDQAMVMIRTHPLTGIGYGNYNRASFEYVGPLFSTVSADFQKQLHTIVVHNGYMLIAAELGLPALLLFLYIMWRFMRLPWQVKAWRDPGLHAMAIGLAGSMVAQAMYWNSDNYYADPRVFLTWLSAGLLRSVVLIASRESAAGGSP